MASGNPSRNIPTDFDPYIHIAPWSASYERDEPDQAQPVADPDRRASPRSLSLCVSGNSSTLDSQTLVREQFSQFVCLSVPLSPLSRLHRGWWKKSELESYPPLFRKKRALSLGENYFFFLLNVSVHTITNRVSMIIIEGAIEY